MEEEINLGLRVVTSVEADDVVVLIFHPNPAHKSRSLLAVLRMDVDYEATDLAQKFATHEREIIKFFLEVGVEHHHLGKTHGQVVQRIDASQLREHAMAEAGLADERDILRTFTHVEAS